MFTFLPNFSNMQQPCVANQMERSPDTQVDRGGFVKHCLINSADSDRKNKYPSFLFSLNLPSQERATQPVPTEQLEGEHCSIPHSSTAFKTDPVTALWELRPSLQHPPNTKQTKLTGQTPSLSPLDILLTNPFFSLWFNDSASSTVQMGTALNSVTICSGKWGHGDLS